MRALAPPLAPRPRAVAPWRTLLLLALLMLLVHVLLLDGASLFSTRAGSSALNRPLETRQITPAPRAAEPVAARPTPRPAPRPRAAPATPPPPPAAAPADESADNPPSAAVESGDNAPNSIANTPSAEPTDSAAPPAGSDGPAATPPPPTVIPSALRLKYDIVGQVRQFNYNARGELLWAHDGQNYDAQLEIRLFLLGSRLQTSRGQITSQGLMPKRFSDKVRSEVAAHFEYDKGKVIFSANTPDAPLTPGAQDQLSIFIQIASLLAADPQRYPRGSSLEMQAVGPRESEVWRFRVDGEERLNLPGGEVDTLQLTRTPNQPHALHVELWLAPSLGHLPVRIRLTQDNGDYVDMQWRSSDPP